MSLGGKKLEMAARNTLQDHVCSTLRKAIFKGHFAPNEHLVQEELAEQLGVSRHPIREALKQLEKEGLVVCIPHKGAQVAGITIDDIEEIYALRVLNEGLAASISFPRLSSDDIKKLNYYIAEMEKAINREDEEYYCQLNQKFHEQLLIQCNWKRVLSLLENLWNGFSPYVPSVTANITQSLEEHKKIIELIEAKEFDGAVLYLKNHIKQAGILLISHIKKQPNFSINSIQFVDKNSGFS